MELPFIVRRTLTEAVDGITYESQKVNVHGPDECKRLVRIASTLRDILNEDERAAKDAEFAKKYPEHIKKDKVRDQSQAIGEFIEYGGYELCTWPDDSRYPVITHKSIEDVLAEYFKIDMHALEAEKQQMLEELAGK